MLCLCGALLNPDVAPAALPEPYRQRPSRAAGSFIGHIRTFVEQCDRIWTKESS